VGRELHGFDRCLGELTLERLTVTEMCQLGTGQLVISTGRAIIVTLQHIILGGWLAQVAGQWAISGHWLAILSGGLPRVGGFELSSDG
jgi:hypothetical protein